MEMKQMKVVKQLENGNIVMEMTANEAMLLGCLEDAFEFNVENDGPPGTIWYQNTNLEPALRAVAAFSEVLARANGVKMVVDDLVQFCKAEKLYDISSGRVWLLRLLWFAVGALVAGVVQWLI